MNLFSKFQILLISVFNNSNYIFGVPLMLQYSKLVIRILLLLVIAYLLKFAKNSQAFTILSLLS